MLTSIVAYVGGQEKLEGKDLFFCVTSIRANKTVSGLLSACLDRLCLACIGARCV